MQSLALQFKKEKETLLSLSEKKLKVYFPANGFTFSTTDKNTDEILSIVDYQCSFPQTLLDQMNFFRNIFAENDIHSFGFETIDIIFPTQKQVWIPEELFSEDHKADYLKALTSIDLSETVLSLFVPEIKAFSVFAIPQSAYAALKVLIPLAIFQSQQTALLKKYVAFEKDKPTLFANIRKHEVDILFFDKDKFLLGNTFPFQNENDILYHSLNVVRQLKFNEKETEFCFSGYTQSLPMEKFQKLIPQIRLPEALCSSEDWQQETAQLENRFLLC